VRVRVRAHVLDVGELEQVQGLGHLDDAAHRGPVALQCWWSVISTHHRLHRPI
jgi:hypothetical protein